MKTVTYKAGETVIREGEEGGTAFLIVSGTVEISVGDDASATVVGKLEAGDVFGEMSLIDPGPRSATVKAVTDIECILTGYDDFIASVQSDPAHAILFMKTLVRRLREMNERMAGMDPSRRGLRGMFRDWQKSFEPRDGEDLPPIYWTMMW
ncbi:MAG: cyclic nucleotide-binding domain-containing protein [Nitratireductor sp.]|uniref:Cyclic nucleotide-binding domain-containing protein n=1 Tax=Bauldia litoralis TaxID=665467 RepID=A0A1G6AKS1_9HYPH|nr:cyclic nucleotide-binding domain-containing protein [Bauldia litoralis]SDB08713.1 Cyclic nucleotide-binding domain-containing protein [Bauldia litoralis]